MLLITQQSIKFRQLNVTHAFVHVYRKAALKDSLQRAILNVFGVSSNITVSDIEAATQAPYYTSPPNTTTSTVGTHDSNT